MTDALKGIAVGCTDNAVYVRVVGRGTFQNSQPLRRFVLEMIDRGQREFIVDLSQCQGMDSTFLGVLAGIGLRLQQNSHPGKVTIINANARNLELVQTLGLDLLFAIDTGEAGQSPRGAPAADSLRKLADSDLDEAAGSLDKVNAAKLMLDAHTDLVRADKRNEPKFKDLTRFLREDLARRGIEKKEP
jgi:anti-sigma B factor antagonist